MTVETIVVGVFTGVMVVLVNEAYRRNLKKEIYEVKKTIVNTRLDLKKEIYEVEGLIAMVDVKKEKEINEVKKMIVDARLDLKKDKELMELLKREVPRINEEE